MPYFAVTTDTRSSVAYVAAPMTREVYAASINVPVAAVEELTAQEYDARKVERSIKRELSRVDSASVRALRAISLGQGTEKDRANLAALEEQAQSLRNELKELRA